MSSLFINAQEELKISELIKDGSQCLRDGNSGCLDIFENAIEEAKSTVNDSIISMTYLDVSMAYTAGLDPSNKSLKFAEDGLKIIANSPFHELKINLLRQIRDANRRDDKLDMLDSINDTILSIARYSKDTAIICTALRDQSRERRIGGNFNQAFQLLNEAKELSEQFGDIGMINLAYNDLATACGMNGDFVLSRQYAEKAREGFLSEGDTMMSMYSLTNWCNVSCEIGEAHLVLDKLPLAIEYFERHRPSIAMYPRAQLGKALGESGRLKEALEVDLKALEEAKHYGNEYQEAYCNLLISQCYLRLKNNKLALSYSGQAFAFHKEKEITEEYLTAYLKHSEALIANKKFEEAVPVLIGLQQGKDSMFQIAKMKEIAAIQQQLEFEQKENQICAQESEINLLQKEKEVISNRNIALILGILLSSIIGLLLLKRKSTLVKLKEAEKDKLNLELEGKRRELTSQALHLAQKNELLSELKNDLLEIKHSGSVDGVKNLSNKIKFDEKINNNWEQFTKAFTETNSTFVKNLTTKHKGIGKNDMRLAALISMNLASKEIASILNISDEGVKKARYRLRKKLGLRSEDNLANYLASM